MLNIAEIVELFARLFNVEDWEVQYIEDRDVWFLNGIEYKVIDLPLGLTEHKYAYFYLEG